MDAIVHAVLQGDSATRLAIRRRTARAAARKGHRRIIAVTTLIGLVLGTGIAAAAGQGWLDGALAGSFIGMGVGVVVSTLKRRAER